MAGELVSTSVAAKAIGVSQSTLVSWVNKGMIQPHFTTMGGHYRWNIERLKAEIRAMQQRDE